MTAYLQAQGARVGLYSTGQQWSQIVGRVPADSNLAGRDSWLAGSTSVGGARAACSATHGADATGWSRRPPAKPATAPTTGTIAGT